MLILRDTDTIKVVLGGAVTTNELPIVESHVDVYAPDGYEPDSANQVLTTGAADVIAVAAPAAGKKRQTRYLGIYNKDTVVATVTVKVDRGGVQRELIKVAALPVGALLSYTDTAGWRVNKADGGLL